MEAGALRLLVTLDVLLRVASVKEAAQLLGLSGPAVSRQLQQLRELTGDPLLLRRGNRMVPTPRAEELRAELGPRLRALSSLLQPSPSADPAQLQRSFVLLTADVVAGTFLPGLMRRLAQLAPRVQLRLLQISDAAEGVAPSLWEGMADLHVGPALGLSEGLVRRRLFEMGHAVLCRPDHPDIIGPIDIDTYCRLPHILVTSRFPTRSWVDEGLSELGRRREVALAMPYFAAAAVMVGQSDMICTMPELPARGFARQLGLCLHRPPLESPRLPIFLHWEERLSQDPAHAWLRQQVAEASAALVEAEAASPAPDGESASPVG